MMWRGWRWFAVVAFWTVLTCGYMEWAYRHSRVTSPEPRPTVVNRPPALPLPLVMWTHDKPAYLAWIERVGYNNPTFGDHWVSEVRVDGLCYLWFEGPKGSTIWSETCPELRPKNVGR